MIDIRYSDDTISRLCISSRSNCSATLPSTAAFPRPLQLTSAGQIYYEGCCDLLRRHERLRSRVGRMRIDGQIRVDAIYSAGIGLLETLGRNFEAAHPNVRINIEYKHPEQVHEAVRHQRCDLGICSYPDQWQGVESQLLRDEPMVLVCRPDHRLATVGQVEAESLDGMDMVGFEAGLPLARHLEKYFRRAGAAPVLGAVFDNIDTILEAVADTDRLAIVPERTARRHLETGQLVAVQLNPPLFRPLGIIHPKRGRLTGPEALSPTVRAFVEFLHEHARGPVEAEMELSGDGGER